MFRARKCGGKTPEDALSWGSLRQPSVDRRSTNATIQHEQHSRDDSHQPKRVVDQPRPDANNHVETHRGYTRLGIQLPFTKTALANVDELMEQTEIVRVTETESIELAEVEGL